VPELVARAHTDQGELGSQHGHQLRGNRVVTTVVPDLQHIDIAEHPTPDGRLQNDRLTVAGQQRRELPASHEQHDARLVGRGILDLLGR
jgi:hypothetical protein